MAHNPFTKEAADEISEDFEDLVDTEFKIGASPLMLIAGIAVTPFDEAGKKMFIEHYPAGSHTTSPGHYTASEYDVILITCEAEDETNYSYIDIRTFADMRGIKYAFPS